MKEHKGTIVLGPSSNLRKTGRTEITFFSEGNKAKEYKLLQAESGAINYAVEKSHGRTF